MLKLLQQQLQALLSVSDQSCNTLTTTDGGHGDGQREAYSLPKLWWLCPWPHPKAHWLWSGPYCDYSKQSRGVSSGLVLSLALTVLSTCNVQATSLPMSVLWAWFRTAILFIWSNFLFWEWQWGVRNSEVSWGHVTLVRPHDSQNKETCPLWDKESCHIIVTP